MDLAYLKNIPLEEFASRREKLLEQMVNNSVAVLFSAKECIRNNDCCYPFRQESNFWYLTSFNEPNAVLLLIKQLDKKQSILFLRPNDPLMEQWHGRRLGIENVSSQLGIDEAYNIADFDTIFPQLTHQIHTLYIKEKQPAYTEKEVNFCRHLTHFHQQVDLSLMLDEMRLFKSRYEIALLQQAGQISALGHIRAMKETRPNRLEYEIESEIRHEFNRHQARFEAYNTIVASGENACILHYTENDHVLKNGDLLLIDAGCEFAMYAGDISRTFPINGKFSPAQREIYELVLNIQKYAIAHLIPEKSIQQVNDGVIRMMVEGLLTLGIMKGNVDELIEKKAYQEFYMHGLGHWLGLDVHDVGRYSKDGSNTKRDRPLEAGMVLTVEPGIYISSTANVPEQYKGIGIRIEDNILITEYGNKILTSAVPKEIDDIEKLMAMNSPTR